MMRKLILMATTASMALLASQAQAQTTTEADDDSNRLGEIVVTAQKRAENIQDVPISILSVSGEELATAGINDPVALQKLAPTLQINNTLFGSGVVIRIRGFGSAANTPTDSEVASYLDGAYVPRPGALLTSFLDVKNVEVLSGPQGTLFGRNAALGAISINTNEPSTTDRTLNLNLEGARFQSYSASAVANLPAGDNFAVRLAGKFSGSQGQYKNLFDRQTYGERNGFVGRVSTKLAIGPALTWVLRADYTSTKGDGVFPQTVYTKTARPAQLAALASFVTNAGGTSPVFSDEPSFTFNQRFDGSYNDDRQYGITSHLNFELSPVLDVRLINNYRKWQNDQQAGDTIGTTLDLLRVKRFTESRQQSNELQLVSAKNAFLGDKLSITAGLYHAREAYVNDTVFNFGSQFCTVVLKLAPAFLRNGCIAGPQANAAAVNFDQIAKSYAVYGQTDFAILPNLSLGLGARHTWDKKTGVNEQLKNNPGAASISTTQAPLPLFFKDDRSSFRASLSWDVTPDILFFGTFSTGYKSGGFNAGGNAALTAAERTFESETVKDYQLGVKSILLDRRVRLNVTLFNTELKDFQDRSFDGTRFLVRNSGDVRSRGIDVDGNFLPIDNLKISFGGTYLDSKYISNALAPGLEGCKGGPGCPTTQNLAGKSLAFAPKLQGNVSAEIKTAPFGDGYQMAFSVSERFSASFLTSNTLNEQSRVPAYATTDLRVSLHGPDRAWRIDLFGTNVLDKRYLVTTIAQTLGGVIPELNNPVDGTTVFRGFVGDRASYGVRLAIDF